MANAGIVTLVILAILMLSLAVAGLAEEIFRCAPKKKQKRFWARLGINIDEYDNDDDD